jgi:hypothetical protein
MEDAMDDRPGCLGGLLRLFFLQTGYDWAQRNIGFGRGGCSGCGCGFLLLIIFIVLFFSILFGTSWNEFRLMVPAVLMM